ncbi:hypothetical protein BDR26DRAFT_1009926 [Obelidium mucronatum]|nr:hypothetical protein BDR26DRAFT_1009926 [Obelidium mucronatum]
MNSSNSTVSGQTAEEKTVLLGLGSFGLSVSLISTLFHVGYVLYEEWTADRIISFKKLKQEFNLNLAIMGFAICGLYVSFLGQESIPGANPWIFQAINDALIATYEFSYVRYSSSRGLAVITMVYPKLETFLRYFLKVQPLLVYAQVIPASINAYCSTVFELLYIVETGTYFEQALSILSAITVLCFDMVFLTGFIKFMTSLRKDLNKSNTDQTFPIIAHHGCVGNACGIASFLFYVGTTAFTPYSFPFTLILFFAYTMLNAMYIALISMKVMLQRMKKRGGDSNKPSNRTDKASVKVKGSEMSANAATGVVTSTRITESEAGPPTEQLV